MNEIWYCPMCRTEIVEDQDEWCENCQHYYLDEEDDSYPYDTDLIIPDINDLD